MTDKEEENWVWKDPKEFDETHVFPKGHDFGEKIERPNIRMMTTVGHEEELGWRKCGSLAFDDDIYYKYCK